MIELRNITKIYLTTKKIKTEALKDISINLQDKGLVFVLGKSGSGKSTLLNIIGGLDKYESGDLFVDGKSTNKFKQKEFDAYRNTYMGFVFQDFNLLENYTIYQNVSVAMELQNKKVTKQEIDKILKVVGLEGLGNRKTNELSGGQKQRVAIARALIKNPNVILADEPTGNLDSETGKQIFDLLKELSIDKLVVIVSHDDESAKKYADRIIELKDGEIVGDTNNEIVENKTANFKMKSAKLPLKYCLKMGAGNLFHKKIRLCFTVILTTLSLICLGISMSASSFDINNEHIKTLVENGEYEVQINKMDKVIDYEEIARAEFNGSYEEIENTYGNPLELTDEFIQQVSNKTNVTWHPELTITQDSKATGFNFATENTDLPVYYIESHRTTFIELQENEEVPNLIGRLPTSSNEIVVSNYVADNIIYSGINLAKEGNNTQEKYKPMTYNHILSEGKLIEIQGLKKGVKIVGIIQYDLTDFEELKTTTWDELEGFNLYKTYNTIISNLPQYSRVFVNKQFIPYMELQENSVSNDTTKMLIEDKYNIISQFGYLPNEIEAFNGVDIVKMQNLGENEVVIDINVMDMVTKGDYNKKLDEFYEENLKLEMMGHQPKDVNKFTKEYITNNNIVGKTIKTNVTSDKITKNIETYETYTIKGVVLGESFTPKIYYAKEKIQKLIPNKVTAFTMYTLANDETELSNIFANYPITKTSEITSTKYSMGILNCLAYIYILKLIGKYGSIFFLIFAIVLLANFISTSVSFRKKEIGILRALGCKSNDVLKIFIIESGILSIICLFLANLGIENITVMFNNALSGFIRNDIEFLVYGTNQKIYLVTITLAIILIANIIPIKKLTKMKPIDAIKNI